MTHQIPARSVELHILHSFSATNLNRDDTGNPKDCLFGGAHRLRVSSQCLKRAIRLHPIFHTTTQVEDHGTRTKRLAIEWIKPALIEALKQQGKHTSETEAQAEILALYFARNYSSKKQEMYDKDPMLTKTLLYLSNEEISWVVAQLLEKWEKLLLEDQAIKAKKGKKGASSESEQSEDDANAEAQKGKKKPKTLMETLVEDLVKMHEHRTSAPDIALFGRMLADRPDTNIDAACQMAHAISTHAVKTETDFFTAVDDLKPRDTAGADMIGTVAFGSACFYRYARLNWPVLVENLHGNSDVALKTVKAFLLASEAANPSGMGNSHDNNTRPSLLLAVVRDDTRGAPWSLVNAFEEPVFSRNGYINESVKRLEAYWQGLLDFYGRDSVLTTAVAVHPGVQLGATFLPFKKKSLNEWVETILKGLQ